jgi:hypothetical protein
MATEWADRAGTDHVHRSRGHSKLTLGTAVEELTLVTWWGIRDQLLNRR